MSYDSEWHSLLVLEFVNSVDMKILNIMPMTFTEVAGRQRSVVNFG